jgi:type 1 glutamine amidotransferase
MKILPNLSHRFPVAIVFAGSFVASSALSAPDHHEHSNEFVSIFDGKCLDGWKGDSRFWRVEDGAIVGETTPANRTSGNTFLIWENGAPENFELKVQFKLRNHNSGIQYRSFEVEGFDYVLGGYQADIAEDLQWMGAAYGERFKGALARRGEIALVEDSGKGREVVGSVGDSAEILSHIDMKGWNEYHIIANGPHVIQKINGVITSQFTDKGADRLKAGAIGLQLHAGPPMEVRFKNIRLRDLDQDGLKKILFLAGGPSHGYASHEHRAGSRLLARALNESGLDVFAQVVTEANWPENWMDFEKPAAVVMYCDGYRGHMAKKHQDKLQALVDEGVGVACVHFGVEVAPEELGKEFLEWIGGYFEIGWSVNPHWDAEFTQFPEHPIANGVKPFKVRDEWYYHMRFQPEMKNVTSILSALPPISTLTSRAGDKNRGSNPTVMAAVEAGKPQVVAWAYERENGGRGFGFTGGHFHRNWQEDNFRKVVLNAITWVAKVEVPQDGAPSRTPTEIDMELNQDYPKPEPK